jgi:hypothetical protein
MNKIGEKSDLYAMGVLSRKFPENQGGRTIVSETQEHGRSRNEPFGCLMIILLHSLRELKPTTVVRPHPMSKLRYAHSFMATKTQKQINLLQKY